MTGVIYNRAAMFENNNPKFLAKIMVKLPRWIPAKLAFLWNRNALKTGVVVSVHRGEYSKQLLYSVVFEAKDSKPTCGVYFESDIEFLAVRELQPAA